MELKYVKPFDTHCHLNDERFNDDLREVIKGVESELAGCICVGFDLASSKRGVEIAQSSDKIFAAVGMHPHDSKDMTEEMLAELRQLLLQKRVVALGEIGLDYHYDLSPRDIQKKWFIRQLELCIELKMPVIIHLREAYGDMMDILRSYRTCLPEGVMHCYSGSEEIAHEILDMGFHISFAGAVTFKNANKLLDVVKCVPDDRLLIETDSPYLTPVPFRGKRNRPEYVQYVAKTIAELKNKDISEIISITNENAYKLFRIGEIK